MLVSLSSTLGNDTLLFPNTLPATPCGCLYSGFSYSCPYNIVTVLSQSWRWDLNPVQLLKLCRTFSSKLGPTGC